MFHFRDWLAMAILDDPYLHKHFTAPTINGASICWSKPALCEWLADYGRFQGFQVTHTETLAGALG